MEVLALIPARGGSKGIPRKNLLSIGGKPAIAYSIEQAHASKRIDRVIVSTEDDEIASVAADWGAELPFRRPAEFAGDDSPDLDVFVHALTYLREHEGYHCERPPPDAVEQSRAVEVVEDHAVASGTGGSVASSGTSTNARSLSSAGWPTFNHPSR